MRTLNRVLSLLLGLALLGGGLLTAGESALVALDDSPWLIPADDWYANLTSTRLGDRSVLLTAIGIGVAGVILLLAEIRPWAPQRLPIDVGRPDQAWLERRSAQRRLTAAANAVRGVGAARATVRVRRGGWRVDLAVRAHDEDRDAVEEGLRDELARLRAPEPIDLRLRIREPRKVA